MNTPLFNALGSALFNFLWEGLVIALAVVACRANPKTRYRFACAALLAMPAAFFATLYIAWPQAGAGFPVPSGVPALTGAIFPSTFGKTDTGASLLAQAQQAMRWFVPFWLAGMAIFCARSVSGWLGIRRLRRAGATPAPAVWQNRVTELARRLGIPSAVALLESCLVDVPVVAGLLRPVIFIPAGLLTGLPAEQLEYLLIHELTHIRRFDYAMNLLQTAIEGLLFYHPAVWWVSNVLREEREHCCDDAVLALGADARSYASTLAVLASGRLRFAPAANGGSLATRVRRILGTPQSLSGTRRSGGLIPAFLLAFSLALAFVALESPQPLAAQLPAASTPYDKWLQEDVAYIVRDDERAAFRRLQTNDEREQFIAQFWDTRNPTPGANQNPFKLEYYRRIGYTNQHYGSDLPGWKTDRGRIYIIYGPPDEIDSHPSDAATGRAPWELWRYRLIAGIGTNVLIEFRDTNRDGHYLMTSDPSGPGRPPR